MKLIWFTNPNGGDVLINLDKLKLVRNDIDNPHYTCVQFDDGSQLIVRESLEEVATLLRKFP